MKFVEVGLFVLAILFCGALLGMLISRMLPERHLSSETKALISALMAVIGTLSALVLGLLLATANGSFGVRNQEVMQISANMIRLDRLLRRYGPAADQSREILRQYAAMKTRDLFPEGARSRPNVDDPQTIALIEDVEDRLLALKPGNNSQQWLQTQALHLVNEVATARWALVGQSSTGVPRAFLVILGFWLLIVFVNFGLFAPPNALTIAALFVCAVAVSGAFQLVVDMDAPFQGTVRISSTPMHHALEELSR
jgi:hypothetical protein